MLPQAELTPDRLREVITGLLIDPAGRKEMGERALARGRPQAAREIVSKLLTLIS